MITIVAITKGRRIRKISLLGDGQSLLGAEEPDPLSPIPGYNFKGSQAIYIKF